MDTAAYQFGTVEYLVIILMLLLSVAVGVYFTFWSKQDSYNEYMLGGRKMGVFPVAMSQVASHISGLAIVATPAEVYSYGTIFSVSIIMDAVIPIINITMFLPIFYNLQLNSVYEYLELRFSHTARVVGSLIFTISQVIYLPAIIYVPALVLNQVSGIPVTVVAATLCIICILYTTFGGFKAVLWTDALQNTFSLFAVIFVIYLGCNQLGGVGQIFNACKEGGRLEYFDMTLSPFVRSSFLAVFVGSIGNWMCNLAIHPGAVQRCLSVPTLSAAKRVLFWTAFGVLFVHAITIFQGMILYARYQGCDPVASGEIKKTGQLVPLFVMEVTRDYPGLAGLFVSGVLSASLSSISAAINTMAGSLYEDIVEFLYHGKKPSDAKQSVIMKTLSILLGGLCVCLVLLVDKTDSLFQIGMSLYGITNGALLTMFIMGIFIPRSNSKGAIAGAVTSLAVMAWVVLNAQYYTATGRIKTPAKFTSVDRCLANYSSDPQVQSRLETYHGYGTPVISDDSVPLIYQISYMYYTCLGTAIGLLVGVLVSILTEPPNLISMDRRLFSPYVHHYFPQLTPGTRSKSSSVKWAEEEFTLINFTKTPIEEDHQDNNEVEEQMNNDSFLPNVKTSEHDKVPPKEDINKPE